MSKYIFVTGGVVSSLGKGITAASLGCLLKSRGYRVSIQKLDPYINFNPGNLSPFQHGEIFVTEDGAETDLDLGHYERFIDEDLTEKNNYTAGKIYWSIIEQERNGQFQGGTVQVIPHVTNEIKHNIQEVAHRHDLDVLIVEVGGTVGDIESLPFLEAIRQMKTDVGKENVLYLHVTLVPYLPSTEELKTKPTQHSVKELRSIGIQPDIIVCRSDLELSDDIKGKIALFCDIKPHDVVVNFDTPSIYEVPLLLQKEKFDEIVIDKLSLNGHKNDSGEVRLDRWKTVVEQNRQLKREVNIALLGKYVSLKDAYLSVSEALDHGAVAQNCRVNLQWVDDARLEEASPEEVFQDVHGVIVPGGMGEGEHGLEAKVKAVNWCRRRDVPFLGINTGLYAAFLELARNLGGENCDVKCDGKDFHSAHAAQAVSTTQEANAVSSSQHDDLTLGSVDCYIQEGTMAYHAYQKDTVSERCRHTCTIQDLPLRSVMGEMEANGVVISGFSRQGELPYILELPEHPWFLATQFHPEFKSRPLAPHPLICSFLYAAQNYKYQEKAHEK